MWNKNSRLGEKVEEAENELKNIIAENTTTNSIISNDIKTSENSVMTNSINTTNNTEKKENTLVETHSSATEKTEEKKEVKFNAPIKGEIIREFAPDALVYSETLEEWVTHNGVDIKADKTSVVVACAKGTVTAIKNDPRYGITVIVTHDDGYQSVYANLLTAEYVVEGENIEAGQTIGTIGNSASFEIADEYHLHFELLKYGDYVNPENLITFE